jgi:hypothetical protein
MSEEMRDRLLRDLLRDGKKLERARQSVRSQLAYFFKLQAGAHDEVAHCPRHHNLAGRAWSSKRDETSTATPEKSSPRTSHSPT